MQRMPLVVGNWKMNGTIEDTLKMLTELRHKLPEASPVEVVVAPPFTSLYTAHVGLQDSAIQLAAQNMYWELEGAFTGEISAVFLKDAGCSHVILGHSERRQYFGETDDAINKKILAALAQELVPIVCIGESLEQRKSGKTEAILELQLKKGLHGIPMNDLKGIVIAYEPVWAIGAGQTATMTEIESALHFVRNVIAKTYDAPTANAIRLLYGGSVTAETAREIFKVKEADGLLVGGASLNIDNFLKIIQSYGVREA